MKKTHNEFVLEIDQVNPTVEVLGQYINAHSKIKCKCRICGHIWFPVAQNLRHKQKCPACANRYRNLKRTITQEDFVRRVHLHHPHITILGNYTNAHSRVHVRCEHCNNEWNPLAWDILKGTGCPNCAHTSTSFLEQFILLSFRQAIGDRNVLSRDKMTIGKELDIYIPLLKFAIEPGSWFWHKSKISNDNAKRELCAKKGIKLITIYDNYKENDANDESFTNDTIKINKELSSVEDAILYLKPIVLYLFNQAKIDCNFEEEDWKKIKNLAYLSSRKVTTDQFVARLDGVNPKINVLGEYKGYNRKIEVQCKKCGYVWDSTPGHLIEGKACPKCAGIMKKTNEEFLKQLKIKKIEVTPLEPYINNHTPIKVQCQKCDNIWDARPANILFGFGCPVCARKKTAKKLSLNQKDFLQSMSEKGNPNIIILSDYVNSRTKIKCKCKKCNYEWYASPNALLQGNGCHKCNGGISKKVKCLTTGDVYSSLSEAARVNRISLSTLSNCCNGKKDKAGGKEWAFINEQNN